MFSFFTSLSQQPDIAARYDEVTFFSEGLAAVKQNNRWGFIDTAGNLKIDYQFTETENFVDGLCKIKARGNVNEELSGVIRKDGTFLLPIEYQEVYIHDQEILFSKRGKYGFVNRKTNQIIHLANERLIGFQNELGLFIRNEKYGLLDLTGKTVVEPIYEYIDGMLKGGFYLVTLGGKKGVLDKNGKEVIPLRYQELAYLKTKFVPQPVWVATLDNGKKCLLDLDGKQLSMEVDAISNNSGDPTKIVFKQNNRMGVMNFSGEVLIPAVYAAIYTAYGYCIVSQDSLWGLVNEENKILLPIQYDFVNALSPTRFVVERGKERSLVSNLGEMIASYPFIDISLHDGLIRIQNEGKFGFVDTSGNILIPCQYDIAEGFYEGLAKVELNNKTSFIDPKGKLLFDFTYKRLTLSEDRVIIDNKEKSGIMDRQGKVLLKPQYDEISGFFHGVASIKKGKKYGWMYKDGQVLQKAEVTGVDNLLGMKRPVASEGWVAMKKGKQWGFLKVD